MTEFFPFALERGSRLCTSIGDAYITPKKAQSSDRAMPMVIYFLPYQGKEQVIFLG